MPSPIITTVWPSLLAFWTKAALSSGRTSAKNWSTPTCFAMAAAVRSLSPVIMTVLVMPRPRRARSTREASGRSGSAMQMTPARWPEAAR